MKSFNVYFTTQKELKKFISDNNIIDSDKLLIQVFTSQTQIEAIYTIQNALYTHFKKATLIGATTDGEIKDGRVSTNTTVINFTLFEFTTLKAHIMEHKNSSFNTGNELAQAIVSKDTKLIISFGDGLYTNGEEFLNGLTSKHQNIIIAGGLAGDRTNFTQTFIFSNNQVLHKGAIAVSLNSDILQIHTDFSFNWESIGKELTITHAIKNRVFTIDNKTAVDTYAHYLGENIAQNLPDIGIEFPLIVKKNGINIARAVVSKEADNSLNFAGNLKTGDVVRFGYGNAKYILNKSHTIHKALDNFPSEVVFIYSCMARRHFMPQDIEQEILPMQSVAPVSGFFTYGEFFTSKTTQLHNQTMTLLSLSENTKINKKLHSVQQAQTAQYNSLSALTHLINVTSKENSNYTKEILTLNKKLQRENAIQIKQLFKQSRLAQMGEMISMIAHQWRQPLSAISTTAANLEVKIKLGTFDLNSKQGQKEQNSYFLEKLNTIEGFIQNLTEIIDDFRNFYKPNKLPITTTFENITHKSLNIIIDSLKNDNITLIYNLNSHKKIKMFENEMMQVILNILKNAQDNFKEKNIKHKYIKITSFDNELSICDNGGGINKNIISKIFDPYFSTKHTKNGTGLGLYMSKIIIEEHHNSELIVNNSEDGVCFTIKLNSKHDTLKATQ